MSCRPAISIALSAACSALWRHLANDGHLKDLPARRAGSLLVIVNGALYITVLMMITIDDDDDDEDNSLFCVSVLP